MALDAESEYAPLVVELEASQLNEQQSPQPITAAAAADMAIAAEP